jgi:transposase
MDTSAKRDEDDRGGERARRQMRTLEEKLAIVEEATRPGASVAFVARQHGVNANLVFGWLRLHRRGLLESRRHGKSAPLLPVKITTPTLTPTEPSGARTVKRRTAHSVSEPISAEARLEIVLAEGVRLYLSGDAERAVLERILERLPRR